MKLNQSARTVFRHAKFFVAPAPSIKGGSLKIYLIALVVALLLPSLSASADTRTLPTKISFQRLFENKDVAIGSVEAIVQDKQGYIWIGGENGLLRYDGYEFRLMGQKEYGGERVKNITHLFVDSRGILWVMTSLGLLRYYPAQEDFVRYANRDPNEIQLADIHIKHMAELPSGELVLATVNGMNIYNVETNVMKVIKNDPENYNSILNDNLWGLTVDKKGNIWVGHDKGVDMIRMPSGDVTHYSPKQGDPNSLTEDQALSIAEDKNGDIWVGTTKGLNRIALRTGKITRFHHDADDPNSISANAVRVVFFDSRGTLWVGTDQGGLSYYDDELEQFRNFKFIGGVADSLSTNVVRSIYEDRNGDLWVGNYPTGVSYFDRSTSVSSIYKANAADPKSLGYNSVLTFSPDGAGNYWLGTDGAGLEYFDRKTDTFKHYVFDPKDSNSISANAVLTTLLDSQGVLWAGTWGAGYNRFDAQTGNFVRYTETSVPRPGVSQSKALNSPNVRLIKEDKAGYLWFGTQGGALSKLDRQSGIYTHYMPDPSDSHAILRAIIYSMCEDSKGRFWVGTENSLELLDREKNTFTHFQKIDAEPTSLSNSSILSCYEDSKGRMWFGTYDGINMLLADGKSFRRFGKKEGLYDSVIRSMVEGPDGQLWIGTSNGISSLNLETWAVKNYYKNNGWQTGDFNPGAAYRSPIGELFFGGINGFSILNLSELKANTTVPPVAITDFKLFTDSVKMGAADGLLKNAIDQTNEVTFNYKQSMFSFTFAALNFRDPAKNEYAYKLEGFDQDWRSVGTQRYATYTNIDSGEYVFRVRGSNNDGVWNDQGAALTIIQLPPPWKTWWAYTIYGLAVIGLLVWFAESQRAKRRRVEEQNKILEVRVAERTAELQKKNQDIESMLSNMQQGLFTIVGNGFIDPEYSAFLESIFETNQIAGENAADFLFTRSNLGSDAIDQSRAAIDALVGADEMMFDFNRHALITEQEIKVGEKSKILALDWNPIVVGEEIRKLMVTVRDVTELKALELEANNQKRELDMVGQLLNVTAKKFQDFEKSSREFLRSNRELLTANETKNKKVIEELFRNMHTIKGNSRTYGFTYLTNIVHNVESTYSKLREHDEEIWNSLELLKELESVHNMLEEYAHVYYAVLHRGDDSNTSRGDGCWIEDSVIASIKGNFGTPKLEPQLSELFDLAQSAPVPEVLENIVHSLSPMAVELGKEPPNVKFATGSVRIRKGAYDLVGNVFMHLLRNSLDHGLGSPAQRKSVGKPAQGEIEIRAEVGDDFVSLICRDDGRGLNMQRLYEKGIETKQWSAGDRPDPYSIAGIIFQSGVSTKEQVSSISGRGVGMDAVATFLNDQGGSITFALLAEPSFTESGTYEFLPFETVIKLPKSLCLIHS